MCIRAVQEVWLVFKCHALGMWPVHHSCCRNAGDTPDEVVITAYRPYELWSSPGVFQMILKAAHDGAQAMLSSPQGHLLHVVSNVMVRVDVVLGASWNSSGEITLWPMVNEMDWFNSAGMLSSFWMGDIPIGQVTDEPTSSLVAVKHSQDCASSVQGNCEDPSKSVTCGMKKAAYVHYEEMLLCFSVITL